MTVVLGAIEQVKLSQLDTRYPSTSVDNYVPGTGGDRFPQADVMTTNHDQTSAPSTLCLYGACGCASCRFGNLS
jgi:hypothetical protein